MAEGSIWEAFQHAALRGARQPDRDRRRQPPRPDARDDARLGPRGLRGARAGVRLARDRDRRSRRRRDRRGLPRGDRRRPDVRRSILARTQEGPRRQGGRGPARQARQAARRPRGGDRGARRRARPDACSVAKPAPRRRRTASRPPAASSRAGSSARRSRRARPTARRWRRSARSAATSSRSTARSPTRRYSELFAKAHPDRYFEMFIAEQQMIAAAVGMQVRDWVPFASTFAAFLSRAYDFVRMAAISRANLRLSGSHAGVSIGEDGPSQMALEDIAVAAGGPRQRRAAPLRRQPDGPAGRRRWPTGPGSPTCGRCAGRPTVRTAAGRGRADRRQPDRCASSDSDEVTIVACGITVPRGRRRRPRRCRPTASRARVIDCYSIKPIDAETLRPRPRARRARS